MCIKYTEKATALHLKSKSNQPPKSKINYIEKRDVSPL